MKAVVQKKSSIFGWTCRKEVYLCVLLIRDLVPWGQRCTLGQQVLDRSVGTYRLRVSEPILFVFGPRDTLNFTSHKVCVQLGRRFLAGRWWIEAVSMNVLGVSSRGNRWRDTLLTSKLWIWRVVLLACNWAKFMWYKKRIGVDRYLFQLRRRSVQWGRSDSSSRYRRIVRIWFGGCSPRGWRSSVRIDRSRLVCMSLLRLQSIQRWWVVIAVVCWVSIIVWVWVVVVLVLWFHSLRWRVVGRVFWWVFLVHARRRCDWWGGYWDGLCVFGCLLMRGVRLVTL